jgi:hypothetical protein
MVGSKESEMQKVYDLGQVYKQCGGVFESKEHDCKLTTAVFSRPESKGFIQQYGDFRLIDGTHGTNLYGLLAITFFVL